MRVLLGLNEVANNLQSLKKGFDAIGIQSDIILVDNYQFGINEKLIIKNWNISLAKYFIAQYQKFKKNTFMRIPLSFLSSFARLLLLLRCIYTYDVFIMIAYSRFLDYKELPLLRFFNKKIIYLVVGSDFRAPYFDGSYFDKSLSEIYRLTLTTKNRVDTLEKYASYIISYSVVSHFQKSLFIDLRYIGIAVDVQNNEIGEIPPYYWKKSNVKIVHAPTNKIAKGSMEIIAAIEKIKEHYDVEFVLLHGMGNREVMYHIATSDFVIDQLYSGGGYMARFSCEAASLGKPSIVTGYDMEHFYEDIRDKNLIPPIMKGEPEDIEKLIIKMIEDEEYRMELGRKAKEFVEKIWNPKVVAKKFKRLIEGDIPKEWWLNPIENSRIWCYGKNAEQIKKEIRDYVSVYGQDALLLEHNLMLKQEVLKLLK